jgi:hypothetical protein
VATYVIAIVLVAFVFDFINGFHDSANSIATVVGTRVLSPLTAVVWAAFFNFVAADLLLRLAPVIRFLDGQGYAWHVTELSPGDAADTRGCLYFFSRGWTLRLRAYPADWEDLGWRELEALRHRAGVLSSEGTRTRPERWARTSEATA